MSAGWERVWFPQAPESLARRWALAPLGVASVAFGAAVWARNALYDRGALPVRRVEGAKVVSVGNLAVGGAGKTPVVIYLAGRLVAAGRRVAVLSRGHGRRGRQMARVGPANTPEEVGDEPLLIARRCPDVAVWVGPDRFELALRARGEGAQVLLLDDGMQHRRLARDLDIVLVDAPVPLGNGRLLPRGPLREPARALGRSDLIWERVEGEGAPELVSGKPRVRARHEVRSTRAPDGAVGEVGQLRDRPVLALAALARPRRFRRSLDQVGARVVAERFFPDHHFFDAADLKEVASEAKRLGAEVVTTEKDAIRLPADFPVWVLRLEVEIISGEDVLTGLLLDGARP